MALCKTSWEKKSTVQWNCVFSNFRIHDQVLTCVYTCIWHSYANLMQCLNLHVSAKLDHLYLRPSVYVWNYSGQQIKKWDKEKQKGEGGRKDEEKGEEEEKNEGETISIIISHNIIDDHQMIQKEIASSGWAYVNVFYRAPSQATNFYSMYMERKVALRQTNHNFCWECSMDTICTHI